jgi:cation transport ATPase
VLSDWLKIRITAEPGQTFLDRMIALVEGAERQKTPKRDRAEHLAGWRTSSGTILSALLRLACCFVDLDDLCLGTSEHLKNTW